MVRREFDKGLIRAKWLLELGLSETDSPPPYKHLFAGGVKSGWFCFAWLVVNTLPWRFEWAVFVCGLRKTPRAILRGKLTGGAEAAMLLEHVQDFPTR